MVSCITIRILTNISYNNIEYIVETVCMLTYEHRIYFNHHNRSVEKRDRENELERHGGRDGCAHNENPYRYTYTDKDTDLQIISIPIFCSTNTVSDRNDGTLFHVRLDDTERIIVRI